MIISFQVGNMTIRGGMNMLLCMNYHFESRSMSLSNIIIPYFKAKKRVKVNIFISLYLIINLTDGKIKKVEKYVELLHEEWWWWGGCCWEAQ